MLHQNFPFVHQVHLKTSGNRKQLRVLFLFIVDSLKKCPLPLLGVAEKVYKVNQV